MLAIFSAIFWGERRRKQERQENKDETARLRIRRDH